MGASQEQHPSTFHGKRLMSSGLKINQGKKKKKAQFLRVLHGCAHTRTHLQRCEQVAGLPVSALFTKAKWREARAPGNDKSGLLRTQPFPFGAAVG